MSALFGPANVFSVNGVIFRIALEFADKTDYGSVYKPVLQEQINENEWQTVSDYQIIWKDIPEQMSAESYSGGMIRKFNAYLSNRFPSGDVEPDAEVPSDASRLVFGFTNEVFKIIQSLRYVNGALVA